ncbi:MAG: hypothetical protein P8P74_18020 [Crocinitomicaceae bacterium]|nr:hypothetical protein [Crocinitomicaceae bacterium]
MLNYKVAVFSLFVLILSSGCNDQGNLLDKKDGSASKNSEQTDGNESSESEEVKTPTDFISENFTAFDKIFGDLNGDGQEDCVVITKGTESSRVVVDEYFGEMDRNRRGIIVLFKEGHTYKLATKNDNCFSSENEDGGVYFPPELSINIKKGKLYLHYAHGRYGYWQYTFRYQDGDFKLIGYDQVDTQGPVMHYSYSYNFLTGKKLTKENINFYSENPEEEELKETWEDLSNSKLISLSSVKDFDDLSFE